MMEQENVSLATELLIEVKSSAKRWFVVSVLLLIFCLVTNCMWIFCWFLPSEDKTVTIDCNTGEGNANYIGESGDIHNGKNYSEDDKKKTKTN